MASDEAVHRVNKQSDLSGLANSVASGDPSLLADMINKSLKHISDDLQPVFEDDTALSHQVPDEYIISPETVLAKMNRINVHKGIPNWVLRDFVTSWTSTRTWQKKIFAENYQGQVEHSLLSSASQARCSTMITTRPRHARKYPTIYAQTKLNRYKNSFFRIWTKSFPVMWFCVFCVCMIFLYVCLIQPFEAAKIQ